MFKKKESVPLTGLREHVNNSVFNVDNAPDGTYNIMVIDIGTLFIKYSLFISYDAVDKYLARSELKYMNDIYAEGKLNFNLLGRDIKRKVEDFSKLGQIDLLVIIPQKITNEGVAVPRLEYREKYKDYKDSINTEYKKIEIKDHVYDWLKTKDNEEEDYHSVLIDSISDDLVLSFNSIAVEQDVKEFYITSPLVPYLGIFDDDRAHLIIDFGHTMTRLVIVKNGTIYAIRNHDKSGQNINDIIADSNQPTLQVLEQKHNSQLSELPLDVHNVILEELRVGILDFISDFHKQFDYVVEDFCVVGGSASLEFEEDLNHMTIGINRIYPKMDLVNDKIIPTETRNYLFNSYGAFMYLLHNKHDTEKVIDFSASKSGGTGLKVKQLVSKYNQYRKPLIATLVGLYALTAVAIYSSNRIGAYSEEVNGQLQQYNNELQSAQGNLDSLNEQYNQLLTENVTEEFKDTGALLYRLKEITPPRFNIKSLQLNGKGDTGTIIVKSDSQVVVSSFITLLQDPADGIFTKANIIDIELIESLGEKYYQTTIYVEGRKI